MRQPIGGQGPKQRTESETAPALTVKNWDLMKLKRQKTSLIGQNISLQTGKTSSPMRHLTEGYFQNK